LAFGMGSTEMSHLTALQNQARNQGNQTKIKLLQTEKFYHEWWRRVVSGVLPATSQILIHRDFSFQSVSKYFKEIQSNSKVFRFIIFLFLCAPSKTFIA
jgi:hypothetical protein